MRKIFPLWDFAVGLALGIICVGTFTYQYIRYLNQQVTKLQTQVNDAKEVNKWLQMPQRIMECESSWHARAYNINMNSSMDIGFWQINSKLHDKRALSLGLDIFQPIDNYIYGLWLYRIYGTKPWHNTKSCWEE